MQLTTIVGARPQFVKAAVVSRAISHSRNRDRVTEKIVHTGQHYDSNMSDIFFRELDIPHPHYHLSVGGGTHGQNTGRMLEKIESVLLEDRPDVVLVYGDTDSTLAGALAASKLHIPVAHVEAGLRSYNRRMPEEINRLLTDHLSEALFTPTEHATKNLAAEGIFGDRVKRVGDVMYDAALFYGERASTQSQILELLGLNAGDYVLATLHRAENTDDATRLSSILKGFAASSVDVVLPVHPRLKRRLIEFGIDLPGNVKSIEPIGFLDMVKLEQSARVIATDSGGVQKEAYFHRVRCITLREETEWLETVEAGCNTLVGANENLIASELTRKKTDLDWSRCIYGVGNTGDLIVESLCEFFQKG